MHHCSPIISNFRTVSSVLRIIKLSKNNISMEKTLLIDLMINMLLRNMFLAP